MAGAEKRRWGVIGGEFREVKSHAGIAGRWFSYCAPRPTAVVFPGNLLEMLNPKLWTLRSVF